MREELKKPECPFCYVSCNYSNCSVVGCDGTKDICNKALYCGVYPYSQFCTPDSCKERLKAYFDEQIERSAKRMLDNVIRTLVNVSIQYDNCGVVNYKESMLCNKCKIEALEEVLKKWKERSERNG